MINDAQETRLSHSRLANFTARSIFDAFTGFRTEFKQITRRAKSRFEARDWAGMHDDAGERLELYKKVIDHIEAAVRELLGELVHDKVIWAGAKAVYSGLIINRDDWEIAESFYNSVTRRIFVTVGVDPQIEFVDTDYDTPPNKPGHPVYRTYHSRSTLHDLVRALLTEGEFEMAYFDLQRDVQRVVREIDRKLREIGALKVVERTEIVKSVFYRGQGAYLVGRMFSGSSVFPIVLALLNTDAGLVVDAVLLDENDVSILFSFTRSYFHIDIDRPYDLVQFLRKAMPRKRVAELYISIGLNKHGKTELYRDIIHHLANSEDQFVIAPGQRGMVMIVFTIPGYDVVFKMIRDKFAYPKKGNRQLVMDKYRFVFNRDRAGRLIDAQAFEYLKFSKDRFTPELLKELLEVAAETVSIEGDEVIIKHAYVERRVIPLDIYAGEAVLEAAIAAAVDYGNAIKDLAASNIFTGDMLLKNFGVTRHGRVVFYDYDELCLLTECNFRTPPRPPSLEELSPEPWFVIGENDIFPGEFKHFIGFRGKLLHAFFEKHADLFEVKTWRTYQERINAGEIIHISPYDESLRLENIAEKDHDA